MLTVGNHHLLADAEGGKNGAQHVLRIHGSGDFSQVRQGLSQFQGCEFRTFLAGDGFRSQPDMLPAEAQFMLVPGIDGYQGAARFTGQGGGKGLDNGFLQFLSSFPGGAGKPDAGHGLPVRMDSQVALVQNEQPGRGENRGGEVLDPGRGGIRHFQNQIRGFKSPVGAGNACLFNDVGRFADTGRINQPQGQPGQLNGFLHRVPRGTGNIADNGPVISQQGIQQAGFSHVGRSGDRRADAFPQQASAFGSFEEGGQFFLHAPERASRSEEVSGEMSSSGKSI